MSEDARARFAADVRAHLDAQTRRSRADVARDAHLSRTHLHRIEHGQRWPSRSVAAALDDALDAAGTLSALWREGEAGRSAAGPATTVSAPDDVALTDVWTRGEARMLADMLDGTDAALTPDAARRLVHEWIVTDPPHTVALDAGRRVGGSTVDTITRRVAQLRRVDDYVSGRDLRSLVEREVAATATVLREGAYTDPTGRALLGALAELCQLAGWVVADAGAPDDAERYHRAGVRAAHAAGDRASAANLVSTLSYQEANTGDPRRAVLLARSALSGADGQATGTVRALLGERVAWAHSRTGDRAATERALSTVDAAYDDRRPDDDPEWTYWLDPDEIAVMAGRCYVELGEPNRAIPLLTDVLDRYDEHRARESALYVSWLAEAHVMAGNVDHGATLADRVLDLTGSTASARGDARVALLRDRLAPHAAVPEVRAFLDRHRAGGE